MTRRRRRRHAGTQRSRFTNVREAADLLDQEIRRLRATGCEQLSAMTDGPSLWLQNRMRGSSGTSYLIETEVYYEDVAAGHIRVSTTIYQEDPHTPPADDDHRVDRISDEFIVAKDGTFVGE